MSGPKVCSECGQPIFEYALLELLTVSERKTCEPIIKAGRAGIQISRVADLAYQDDPEGGPLGAIPAIRVTVNHANKKLAQYGYRIRGSGGLYQLQTLEGSGGRGEKMAEYESTKQIQSFVEGIEQAAYARGYSDAMRAMHSAIDGVAKTVKGVLIPAGAEAPSTQVTRDGMPLQRRSGLKTEVIDYLIAHPGQRAIEIIKALPELKPMSINSCLSKLYADGVLEKRERCYFVKGRTSGVTNGTGAVSAVAG